MKVLRIPFRENASLNYANRVKTAEKKCERYVTFVDNALTCVLTSLAVLHLTRFSIFAWISFLYQRRASIV